jgi:hypothetical protein
MISYGGVPNAISLIVPERSVERAVREIHREFFGK